MGLKQWLHKITTPKRGAVPDEVREEANSVRRLKHAILQQEKMAALMERVVNIEIGTGNKESAMDKIVTEVLPILVAKLSENMAVKGVAPGVSPQAVPGENAQRTLIGVDYTAEQIRAIVASNPNIKKHAKKYSDEEITEYIKQEIPNISKDSLDLALIEVRT